MSPPLISTEQMLCIPVLAASMTAGVCEDAKATEDSFHHLKHQFEQAVSVSSAREACLVELAEVVAECAKENWDGYDAAALDVQAVSRSKHFIEMLPTDYPYPEIGAMPDGDISLDWDQGPRRSLTVVVGPHTRIAYAMIHGDEERSGTLSFMHEIPLSLLRAIIELHPAR